MRLAARGVSGSLHQFTQKVVNKHGEMVEYPKVQGTRNPHNVKHWRHQISWKIKEGDRWRTCCRKIPAAKVASVKQQITRGVAIEVIIKSL
jgi:hypothetical protein